MIAAGKFQQMHQLIKCDAVPDCSSNKSTNCSECNRELLPEDIDLLQEIDINDTQLLLESSGIMKQKIVFYEVF